MKEQLNNQITDLRGQISEIEASRLEATTKTFEKFFGHLLEEGQFVKSTSDHVYLNKQDGDYERTMMYFYMKEDWSAEVNTLKTIELNISSFCVSTPEEFKKVIFAGKVAETLTENYTKIIATVNKLKDGAEKKIKALRVTLNEAEQQLLEIEQAEYRALFNQFIEQMMTEEGLNCDLVKVSTAKNRQFENVTNLKVVKETPKNAYLRITYSAPKFDENFKIIKGEFRAVEATEYIGKSVFNSIFADLNKQ